MIKIKKFFHKMARTPLQLLILVLQIAISIPLLCVIQSTMQFLKPPHCQKWIDILFKLNNQKIVAHDLIKRTTAYERFYEKIERNMSIIKSNQRVLTINSADKSDSK
ncbi:hypothetical protein SS50377_24248 [Spironucleus salmonicida]|uniref:Uncharacterized protein n=1 Tax=Spironucleus salmonicida TaxID=348837 RepID=A0A9P8RYP9_9EUKA|nr:hypothetical protein SS50377_24233 [Spironucleus salmonicida]KAH0574294.1 hypothetical protein SS50377_24248 [Spironucleus salmonicida]